MNENMTADEFQNEFGQKRKSKPSGDSTPCPSRPPFKINGRLVCGRIIVYKNINGKLVEYGI